MMVGIGYPRMVAETKALNRLESGDDAGRRKCSLLP